MNRAYSLSNHRCVLPARPARSGRPRADVPLSIRLAGEDHRLGWEGKTAADGSWLIEDVHVLLGDPNLDWRALLATEGD